MTVWLAFLRAVNVGKRQMKMAELKALCEELGYGKVKTLLASGNVRFQCDHDPKAELEAAIASYRPELKGTAAARDAARFLLLHPPLPWSARPGYGALAGAAVALLPVWARQKLALPYLPVTERVIALPVGGAATSVIRWALKQPPEPRN